MSIPPDYLIERKSMKSKIQLWKGLFFIPILLLLIVLFDKNLLNFKDGKFIARISIEGTIEEDAKKFRKIEALAKNKNVEAVILTINSGGGGVTASEQLYLALKKIREQKPIVSVMGTLAASGGYMISLATDRIFAHSSTITGSIGVLSMSFEVTELAEKLGIKLNSFKSTEMKAGINPLEKVTPEVREAQMALINDLCNFFIDIVAKERKLDPEIAKKLGNGMVYTGRQALELKLVDAIGGEDAALKWLEEEKKIDPTLKVKEIDLEESNILSKLLEPGSKVFSNIYKILMNLFGYSNYLTNSYQATLSN